ncbi:hypothetical protein KY290_025743 [Solanum tuberosum]|uniref:Uncharacterized protein n=1 Tax=Solanum tuberosum TaxID=4113 RepID=A0ABQ7UVL7_SOLTU|nr:hypothetical protein KY289_024802 [Solanum tuberosum]KAH0676757.1 hypothetical protein KY285_024558 [Solanum tuberosum]KAH0755473.1 hypothetical protein KY290_025743 [Solanum tuberosum]
MASFPRGRETQSQVANHSSATISFCIELPAGLRYGLCKGIGEATSFIPESIIARGWNPVMAHQLTDSLISIHSWTLQVTSYPHMESAQGRNPIQWVTGTGLDIKDREKRISAKKENCPVKTSLIRSPRSRTTLQ